MKNIKDCKVGDQLLLTKSRPWTDNVKGTSHTQRISWVVELTAIFENRCEYKAVEVLEAIDVCPLYGDPSEMLGGCSFRLFERSPSSISIEIL